MRRILLFPILVLAGCASTPQPTPTPQTVTPVLPDRAGLIGLTGQEITNRLGVLPALQIREGNGTKLQFRSRNCVLDAYLYPPAGRGGEARVEHVDTRTPAGTDTSEQYCLSDFQAGRS